MWEQGDGALTDWREQSAVGGHSSVDEALVVGMQQLGIHVREWQTDESADILLFHCVKSQLNERLLKCLYDTLVGVGDSAVEIKQPSPYMSSNENA